MNAASGEQIRILVVEDHSITRTGLQLVLGRIDGFEVIGEAGTGRDAVELARSLKPDVVLMDIGLPLLDGVEATKLVKQETPGIRVLMLTSHSDETDIFAAFSSGADGYCLKDASTEQLEMAIRSVNAGAAWLDANIAGKVLSASTKSARLSGEQKRPLSGPSLTERESEVLELIVERMTNQEIAGKLVLSTETVKTHVRHIMEKLQVSDRTQAAVTALRHGLV
jgi:DNA-binding NarL/FixJ family response regulator